MNGDARRVWIASLSVVVLMLALRVPWLGAIPAPAGDETNWLNLALDLRLGQRGDLGSDASFVTQTFGQLLSLGFAVGGPTFFAGRAALVAAVVLLSIILLVVAARRSAPWLGVVTVGFLALHPWSVAWSRTVSVPYALCLYLAVLAPVAWVAAAQTHDPRWRALGLVLAAQLWPLALHFSPLGAALPIACGGWLLLCRRDLLRSKGLWLALFFVLLHTSPLLMGIVRSAAHQPSVSTGITVDRLGSFFRTSGDFLSGESTVRHFSSVALRLEWRVFVGFIILFACAALIATVFRRLRHDPGKSFVYNVALVAILLLGVSWIFLPLALGGGRKWWMPTIDADRYGFVLIAPFALLLGAVAEAGRRARRLVLVWVLLFAVWPTARMAHSAWMGGGTDRGFRGRTAGAWRGWRTTQDHLPPSVVAFQAGLNLPGPVVYLNEDWFSFQPLAFLVRTSPRLDDTNPRRATSWRRVPPGAFAVLPLWAPEMFRRSDTQRARNIALAEEFATMFVVLDTQFHFQNDGRPMLQVMVGWHPPRTITKPLEPWQPR